ncbi:hypothetical protein [Francisella frigiditurris]|uniref:Uncharacterized protein n=1 Tax=Francisella frigiditurris TaxID=1542390 RepID=A0A1J0KUC6_9GAMM|nr:hypothetical protein [Francisella frigiditurris]APC97236.1 hypothetical protein KX01_626 [Francisella frigiditurris]
MKSWNSSEIFLEVITNISLEGSKDVIGSEEFTDPNYGTLLSPS